MPLKPNLDFFVLQFIMCCADTFHGTPRGSILSITWHSSILYLTNKLLHLALWTQVVKYATYWDFLNSRSLKAKQTMTTKTIINSLPIFQEIIDFQAYIQGTGVFFVLVQQVLLCVCRRLVHQSWHNQMVLSQISPALSPEWLWRRWLAVKFCNCTEIPQAALLNLSCREEEKNGWERQEYL